VADDETVQVSESLEQTKKRVDETETISDNPNPTETTKMSKK
jgi:hypothetical protein